MNVLVYFPYNLRTVEQQSVMEMLARRGHHVVLLTTCARGYLHEYVERLGVHTEALAAPTGSRLAFLVQNLAKLYKVVRQHRIELVIAHQQRPALIAGLLRRLAGFELAYFRHNSDEDYAAHPLRARWLNRLVNAVTPLKVAPSAAVERFWLEHEQVPRAALIRINYGYNFRQYEAPVNERVEEIKSAYPARLRVLSIARFATAKRHAAMFEVVARLAKEGEDVKLLCLGSGPLGQELSERIAALGMQERIFLVGRRDNIFDYIEAADVFMHLSSSEASNSAVKEVALRAKPVIVCRGVGDFDDYVEHGVSGFVVDKQAPQEPAYGALRALLERRFDGAAIGEALRQRVTRAFDIERVAPDYERLLSMALGRSPSRR